MRQLVLSLLVAAGAMGVLSSACRSSDLKATPNAAQRVRPKAIKCNSRVLEAQPKQLTQKMSSTAGESSDATAWSPLPGTSFQATTTEHFVLLHEPNAAYVAGACKTLEYAYQYFYDVFAQAGFDLSRSNEHLVWICFPQKSGFNKYAQQVEGMDLSWLDGYYSTLTNRVAIVQPDQKKPPGEKVAGPSTSDVQMAVAAHRAPHDGVLPMSAAGQRFDVTRLTHEVAHQLSFNSGIQKRGVMYPLWVSEGLATNFEFDGSANTGLDHCNAARCNGLLEAYAAGELVPLRQFVVQTTVPADTHVGRRCYAQAWGFFQFVLTERPENLRIYLQRLAEQHSDRRDAAALLAEFTEAFGSPETLEGAWNAFLTRQAQQALVRRSAPAVRPDADLAQKP